MYASRSLITSQGVCWCRSGSMRSTFVNGSLSELFLVYDLRVMKRRHEFRNEPRRFRLSMLGDGEEVFKVRMSSNKCLRLRSTTPRLSACWIRSSAMGLTGRLQFCLLFELRFWDLNFLKVSVMSSKAQWDKWEDWVQGSGKDDKLERGQPEEKVQWRVVQVSWQNKKSSIFIGKEIKVSGFCNF